MGNGETTAVVAAAAEGTRLGEEAAVEIIEEDKVEAGSKAAALEAL
jgi:hypothetical protein